MGTMTFGFDKAQTPKACAAQMMKLFIASPLTGSKPEFDSARMYQNGDTEKVIGELIKENPDMAIPKCSYATKANPFPTHNKTLSAASIKAQCQAAVDAVGCAPLDIFYLHAPDPKVSIEETLKAVQELYEAKQFTEFGLSNYTAWEVAYIWGFMNKNNWVPPTVYQGMYNSIAREVETDLLPCLRRCKMRFYAYNPLGGGVLTGKYSLDDSKSDQTQDIAEGRFNKNTVWGKIYQGRYMQRDQIRAVEIVKKECTRLNIPMTEASLRWMKYHSQLDGSLGDKIIIGASKLNHFEANMAALEKDPLPNELVEAYDKAWQEASPVCPSYSRGYSGSAL